jgi:glyoxylase-like metal-dependent hydrolase (beta-lactamase superfamily II)
VTGPEVQGFHDPDTDTITYLVSDSDTGDAVIIDPVLGFNVASATYSNQPMETVLATVEAQKLNVVRILETHLHADHASGAQRLKQKLDVPVCIGEGVGLNLPLFRDLYDTDDVAMDGSQFDHLFADGESFRVGNIECRVISTPGHTPGCVTYVIGDAAFVGDCLFMPDFGSARCDFPGGDARTLYRSVKRILALPPETRLFTCHDYCPGGRELAWETTVAEQRRSNIHMQDGVDEDTFVEMRTTRDAELNLPRLILPSVQVNIRGGRLPPIQDNGRRYIKLPVGNFADPETVDD